MNLTLPHKLRVSLYIVVSVGSLVMQYLLAKGVVSELEVGLWVGLAGFVSTIAALNVSKPAK